MGCKQIAGEVGTAENPASRERRRLSPHGGRGNRFLLFLTRFKRRRAVRTTRGTRMVAWVRRNRRGIGSIGHGTLLGRRFRSGARLVGTRSTGSVLAEIALKCFREERELRSSGTRSGVRRNGRWVERVDLSRPTIRWDASFRSSFEVEAEPERIVQTSNERLDTTSADF